MLKVGAHVYYIGTSYVFRDTPQYGEHGIVVKNFTYEISAVNVRFDNWYPGSNVLMPCAYLSEISPISSIMEW